MKRILFLLLAIALMVPAMVSHSEAAASKGKILVVASSENRMVLKDGSLMNVGFFLNELAVPTEYLAEQGYDIVVATPSGEPASMDASSNDKKFFGGDEAARAKAEDFVEHLPVITLASARDGIEGYAAVFIPGGHAPMTDLMQDENLGAILRYVHEHHVLTASICHGPVALLAALPNAAAYRTALTADDARSAMQHADDWIYKGYDMTILSDAEEWPGEVAKGTEMPFHVEQALQIAGGTMVEQSLYQSHVVRDRELITGQNPASDIALGKAIDEAVTEK